MPRSIQRYSARTRFEFDLEFVRGERNALGESPVPPRALHAIVEAALLNAADKVGDATGWKPALAQLTVTLP